jgi:chromosome segregation ATPase
VQLLEQQLDRATSFGQQQAAEVERLRREARAQEERLASSLRDSGATAAMDTLCVEIERLNSVLADNLEKMRELQRKNSRLEAELAAIRTEKDHLGPLRLQAQQAAEQLTQQQAQISRLQETLRETELHQARKQREEESLVEEVRLAREEGRVSKEEAKSEREKRGTLQAKLEVISR